MADVRGKIDGVLMGMILSLLVFSLKSYYGI
jgi:hypothetical protein